MLRRSAILFFFILLLQQNALALCSNCKAVVENNGGEFGNGLNAGIFFLAFVPYVILIGIVFLGFRGKIKQGLKNFINS